MKTTLVILITLFATTAFAQTKQQNDQLNISYNGLYVAKTGEVTVADKKVAIYNYVRFYKDGTVITQSVNTNEPQKVAEWFTKKGRFERKGTFTILKNGDIEFLVSNDKSPDKKIEGPKTDKYGGQFKEKGRLFLVVKYANGDLRDYFFDFIEIDKK